MKKYNVAVIGAGAWGKNILKVTTTLCNVVAVGYTGTEQTRVHLEKRHPRIPLYTNLHSLIQNTSFEIVFIATPIQNHFDHVKFFLERGKHVFVEKPLSCTPHKVNELYKIAEKKNLVLFTGYIYLADNTLKMLRDLTSNTQGSIQTCWYKWGSFKSPITTNLLVHEISISHYLLGPVVDIIKKNIQTDTLTIHIKHQYGESNITIDRKKETQRKFLKLTTKENDIYTIENGVLTKQENNTQSILLTTDTTDLLTTECSTFLESIPSGAKENEGRQKIDLSVAIILDKLDSTDFS